MLEDKSVWMLRHLTKMWKFQANDLLDVDGSLSSENQSYMAGIRILLEDRTELSEVQSATLYKLWDYNCKVIDKEIK